VCSCRHNEEAIVGAVSYAERAFPSSRALEAAFPLWAQQGYQRRLAALQAWRSVQAPSSAVSCLLDSGAAFLAARSHDRPGFWGRFGVTIARAITAIQRQLLHPTIHAELAAMKLPCSCIGEAGMLALRLVIDARCESSAVAQDILKIAQQVLSFALPLLRDDLDDGSDQLHDIWRVSGTDQLQDFRQNTLTAFVRCFELFGQGAIVSVRPQDSGRPLVMHKVLARVTQLHDVLGWAMEMEATFTEFCPPASSVMCGGMLILCRHLLDADRAQLDTEVGATLSLTSAEDPLCPFRETLFGTLGLFRRCCQNVQLSCVICTHHPNYADVIRALHDAGYYFCGVPQRKLSKSSIGTQTTSKLQLVDAFSFLLDTPSTPLRLHLMKPGTPDHEQDSGSDSDDMTNVIPFGDALLAIPSSIVEDESRWPSVRRFLECEAGFEDMENGHILLLDPISAAPCLRLLRKQLDLQFITARTMFGANIPWQLWATHVPSEAVRVVSSSDHQLRKSCVDVCSAFGSSGLTTDVMSAETAIVKTQTLLEECFAAATATVDRLFDTAISAEGEVSAKHWWHLGFETCKEICKFSLTRCAIDTLKATLQRGRTTWRRQIAGGRARRMVGSIEAALPAAPSHNLAQHLCTTRPRIVRGLSGEKLRRIRSFESLDASNLSYFATLSRQTSSPDDDSRDEKAGKVSFRAYGAISVDPAQYTDCGSGRDADSLATKLEKYIAAELGIARWDERASIQQSTRVRVQQGRQPTQQTCRRDEAVGWLVFPGTATSQWNPSIELEVEVDARTRQVARQMVCQIVDRWHSPPLAVGRLMPKQRLVPATSDPVVHNLGSAFAWPDGPLHGALLKALLKLGAGPSAACSTLSNSIRRQLREDVKATQERHKLQQGGKWVEPGKIDEELATGAAAVTADGMEVVSTNEGPSVIFTFCVWAFSAERAQSLLAEMVTSRLAVGSCAGCAEASLTVPPQCQPNRLTVFVSSAFGTTPGHVAGPCHERQVDAAQHASEACAARCSHLVAAVQRTRVDYITVDLGDIVHTPTCGGRKEMIQARDALTHSLGLHYTLPQVFFGMERLPIQPAFFSSETSELAELSLWAEWMNTEGAEIRREDLRISGKDALGNGASGTVYRGIWKSGGGLEVAVKLFRTGGATFRAQFQSELRHLRHLRHTHVLSLFGQCRGTVAGGQQRDMLIMELCQCSVSDRLAQDIVGSSRTRGCAGRFGCHVLAAPGHAATIACRQRLALVYGWTQSFSGKGDTLSRIGWRCKDHAAPRVVAALTKVTTTWDKRLLWALGAAKGLAYLHTANIVHSDIKADNVLLSHGDVPKICDFSFSKLKGFGIEAASAGTPGYISPEGPGDKAADVFAFGLFLVELVVSLRPVPSHAAGWPLRRCCAVPTNALSGVRGAGLGAARLDVQDTGVALADWFGPGSAPTLQKFGRVVEACTLWDDPKGRPAVASVVAQLHALRRSAEHRAHRRLCSYPQPAGAGARSQPATRAELSDRAPRVLPAPLAVGVRSAQTAEVETAAAAAVAAQAGGARGGCTGAPAAAPSTAGSRDRPPRGIAPPRAPPHSQHPAAAAVHAHAPVAWPDLVSLAPHTPRHALVAASVGWLAPHDADDADPNTAAARTTERSRRRRSDDRAEDIEERWHSARVRHR
jgi:hypothetical protein